MVYELILFLQQLWHVFWKKRRLAYLRRHLKACGEGLDVGNRVRFEGLQNIELGRRALVGDDCKIMADGQGARVRIGDLLACNMNVFICAAAHETIEIGNDVLIGPNVVIRSGNHSFDTFDLPMQQQESRHGTIRIGNDVWLGANVVVAADVTIGDHAVVGAGAVVVKDVEPCTIVGGVPAKMIGRRPGRP